MQMDCHVKRRHCNIGWLVHRLSYGRSMELVEHVGLVEVVECMCYVLELGLVEVVELEYELDNRLLIQRYIPRMGKKSKQKFTINKML